MEIDEVAKKYPERNKRDRRWFTYEEALVATQNNQYIQEAIRLSTISPTTTVTNDNNATSTSSNVPAIKSTFSIADKNNPPSKEPSIISASDIGKRKPKDSFQALQDLMESAPMSK